MDFYRKVPEDLKQATRAGGACSALWLVLLGWIVLAETGRFLTSEYRSRIDVDVGPLGDGQQLDGGAAGAGRVGQRGEVRGVGGV